MNGGGLGRLFFLITAARKRVSRFQASGSRGYLVGAFALAKPKQWSVTRGSNLAASKGNNGEPTEFMAS